MRLASTLTTTVRYRGPPPLQKGKKMGTFILLVITTVLGWAIGHFAFDAGVIGAVIGFVVGVLLRIGAAENIGDLFS